MIRKVGLFVIVVVFLCTGLAVAGTGQSPKIAGVAGSTIDPDRTPAKIGGIQEEKKQAIKASFTKLPLSFIKNEGQKDKSILFYEQGIGHATAFTDKDISLFLTRTGKVKMEGANQLITLTPLNASPFTVEALDKREGKVNYFVGRDAKNWKTGIPTYGAVLYKGVYPGIDMKFYGSNSQLEYDMIVAPNADPSKVQIFCKGIERLAITPGGELEMVLKDGSVFQKKPFIYQMREGRRTEVQGSFILSDSRTYGFKVDPYDRNLPLVIDPALVYSTYLGGSANDIAKAIAIDDDGNAYVAGSTSSNNFPVLTPFQTYFGGSDAFITKIGPSGNTLVYSTYLGGSSDDSANAIAVDSSGNAYVAGSTSSNDFPLLTPFQTYAGGSDAFIAKIGPSGNALVYSTYLGGSFDDFANAIVVDTSGNAYVAGSTASSNFPLQSPFRLYAAGFDAFITKLGPSGSALIYSSYLGGFTDDFANAIAVDTSGNAYVAGSTTSTTFPVLNPVQASNAGGSDGFITKINPSGSAIAYSTYLGGASNDFANAIAVDTSGNAYVAGSTTSNNFPLLTPFRTYAGGSDAFVTKIGPLGDALVYSTYLGGASNDFAYAIAVDTSGNAYVAGSTTSNNFPLLTPFRTYAGGSDAFVTKIGPLGDALVYSTYLGGNSNDFAYAIAIDILGNAYVAGTTSSNNFPVLTPFRTYAGGFDAFITRIGPPTTTFSLTVTKTGTGTGTVTSSPSGIDCGSTCTAGFAQGTVVTLTATAGDSSLFISWSGGGCSGSSNTCVVTMTGKTTVSAKFVPSTYTITATVSGGHGSATPPSQTVNYLASGSITITADAGYHTDTIRDNGKSVTVANPYIIENVTANHAVTVTFSNKYTLTVQRKGSGTITSSPAGINCGYTCSAAFTQGSIITLTASAGTDYIFAGWGGGCSGTSNTCAVTMDNKATVSATFVPSAYAITASVPGGHGTAAPASQKVNYNADASININPDAGYYIVSISDNGKAAAIANPYVISNVTTNHNVVVGLAVDYTLTAQATGSGTITSSPPGINCGGTCSAAFREGTKVTLTPVPDGGFVFTGWTGDCKGTGTCSVTMNKDRTVGATFIAGSCTYVISPKSRKFNYKGGSVKIGVTAKDFTYCLPPEIIDNSTWIAYTASAFTKNKGSVTLTIPALDSSIGRTDGISIGGNTFSVSQTGVPCTLNLNPVSSNLLSGAGDTGAFDVQTTPNDCVWVAAARSDWVTITGTVGSTVSYSAAPNGTGRARNGIIAVTLSLSRKSKTFTVKQGN